MKDAGLRIRVDRETRAAFVEACRRRDKFASDVIREFMRAFIEEELNGRQADLFKETNN